MLIGAVEEQTEAKLISFLETIDTAGSSWSVIAVRRNIMKSITNDALLLALKPALQDAARATIFFATQTVYIVWSGMRRRVEQQLREKMAAFLNTGLDSDITYVDPVINGNELIVRVRHETAAVRATPALPISPAAPPAPSASPSDSLAAEPEPISPGNFMERKREHRKVTVLVIEDQPFLRKLMFEVLNQAYDIIMAADIAQGLDLYIKHAPHVVFLDISLPDGSGHTLAKKLHKLDPTAYVVMVTGSRERADVVTAKENGVYGFILKPFNKGRILEAAQNYQSVFPHLIGKGH